jgi:hypothetical protein
MNDVADAPLCGVALQAQGVRPRRPAAARRSIPWSSRIISSLICWSAALNR